MTSLSDSYDQVLAEAFTSIRYSRSARGLYLSPIESDAIWYGLWVRFYAKKKRLTVQPSLVVFCPSAAKIVREGLKLIFHTVYRKSAFGLGEPIIVSPLYERVRVLYKAERMPFSYDVDTVDQIPEKAELTFEDFSRVREDFFEGVSSVRALRDRIKKEPSGTAAGINAMALTYLINSRITVKQIDDLVSLSPNAMTKQFAEYLKKKIKLHHQ